MIDILYNILMIAYKWVFMILSPFNKKIRRRVRGLSNQKIASFEHKKIILIHCASLGEFEQASPIVHKILQHTSFNVVISFFSPSGYMDAQVPERCLKIYLPFDTKKDIKNFLSRIRPEKILIIKNEWWWNLITLANQMEISTFLVSSTIRKDHYFLNYLTHHFSLKMNMIEQCFVIDQSSKDYLERIYNKTISISGDTRHDRVLSSRDAANPVSLLYPVIIYGSTWKSDLPVLKRIIAHYPNAVHIIYPHDLSEGNINGFLKMISHSKLIHDISEINQTGVFINKSMGKLKMDFASAFMAYIGGGFEKGIHNILEASVYGIPVFIGPRHQKSSEAHELIQKKCVFSISNPAEIPELMEHINQAKRLEEIQSILNAYFSVSKNGTEIIFQAIFNQTNDT